MSSGLGGALPKPNDACRVWLFSPCRFDVDPANMTSQMRLGGNRIRSFGSDDTAASRTEAVDLPYAHSVTEFREWVNLNGRVDTHVLPN